MNIFTIEGIGMESNGCEILRYHCELKCKLEFKCNKHHYVHFSLSVKCYGDSSDQNEALKLAIQSLFNGKRAELSNGTYLNSCGCKVDKNEPIVFRSDNLPEPYKSLFEQLFSAGDWNILKLLPEEKSVKSK